MKRTLLTALFLAAPLAFARPQGAPPQLPPCTPVNLEQMSFHAKTEEALRFVPVYMPINIFKARAELKPKAAPAKATKRKKRVQVCKRFDKRKKRCTWWIWVTK